MSKVIGECKRCGSPVTNLLNDSTTKSHARGCPNIRDDKAALYDRRAEILADPAISFWLKEAIRALDARDPVDAAKDADLLAALFDGKCKALLGV